MEELPKVIVEEVKPIPTAITTPTQIITQTSTLKRNYLILAQID